ncbi:MAG: hypothetical protein NT081_00855 [Actinobacteria bacterium]|nr:hypothetical protein [Actinomycetota bacterium]
MIKTRTFRTLGILIALAVYLLSIATISPAGAETASVPVTVTAAPTTGLTGTINYTADFSPTVSGKCTPTALGSAGADAFKTVQAVSPYSTATLTFKVGKGSSGSFNLQSGGTSTVQCDETHACKLTLLLQVAGGTVFQSFPLGWDGMGARFNPVTPIRILDTRTTNNPSGVAGRVADGGTIDLQVAGANGIPVDATAVVMNVTAVLPTGAGFVTVWPRGVTKPLASNLNFVPGDVVPNLVTVGIGSNGQVSLFHKGGVNDLLADVVGYYSPVSGDYFTPVTPVRALDTRAGTGVTAGRVAQGGEVALQVTNANSVPANATGVVLNVTAVTPEAAGFVTVYPNGVNRPLASNLNFVAGDVVPNLVIVGIGSGGKVNLFNAIGTIDLVADVVGYYSPDNTAKQFYPVTPVRALDTRDGTGGTSTPVAQGTSIDLTIRGTNSIPAGASAIIMNTTAVLPTADSFLTVWPNGVTRPLASTLNYAAGDVVPNLVQVGIGSNGKVSLFNASGSVDLVADLTGYFA